MGWAFSTCDVLLVANYFSHWLAECTVATDLDETNPVRVATSQFRFRMKFCITFCWSTYWLWDQLMKCSSWSCPTSRPVDSMGDPYVIACFSVSLEQFWPAFDSPKGLSCSRSHSAPRIVSWGWKSSRDLYNYSHILLLVCGGVGRRTAGEPAFLLELYFCCKYIDVNSWW